MNIEEKAAQGIAAVATWDGETVGMSLTRNEVLACARVAISAALEWKPIESASREEHHVILLFNGEVIPGWFWEGMWVSCWHDPLDPPPTKWMRLPSPPIDDGH